MCISVFGEDRAAVIRSWDGAGGLVAGGTGGAEKPPRGPGMFPTGGARAPEQGQAGEASSAGEPPRRLVTRKGRAPAPTSKPRGDRREGEPGRDQPEGQQAEQGNITTEPITIP
eukprot:6521226-Heterocapsa_arctica.AAC.1